MNFSILQFLDQLKILDFDPDFKNKKIISEFKSEITIYINGEKITLTNKIENIKIYEDIIIIGDNNNFINLNEKINSELNLNNFIVAIDFIEISFKRCNDIRNDIQIVEKLERHPIQNFSTITNHYPDNHNVNHPSVKKKKPQHINHKKYIIDKNTKSPNKNTKEEEIKKLISNNAKTSDILKSIKMSKSKLKKQYKEEIKILDDLIDKFNKIKKHKINYNSKTGDCFLLTDYGKIKIQPDHKNNQPPLLQKIILSLNSINNIKNKLIKIDNKIKQYKKTKNINLSEINRLNFIQNRVIEFFNLRQEIFETKYKTFIQDQTEKYKKESNRKEKQKITREIYQKFYLEFSEEINDQEFLNSLLKYINIIYQSR